MTITVRPACDADLDAVLAVHIDSICRVCKDFYSPEQIAAWVGCKRREDYVRVVSEGTIFVAVDHSRVVGFGNLNPERDRITGMYVAPEFIGCGVGGLLITELERLAINGETTTIYLESTLNAVPFYEVMGYVRTGETSHIMPGGMEIGAVCMEKVLCMD